MVARSSSLLNQGGPCWNWGSGKLQWGKCRFDLAFGLCTWQFFLCFFANLQTESTRCHDHWQEMVAAVPVSKALLICMIGFSCWLLFCFVSVCFQYTVFTSGTDQSGRFERFREHHRWSGGAAGLHCVDWFWRRCFLFRLSKVHVHWWSGCL